MQLIMALLWFGQEPNQKNIHTYMYSTGRVWGLSAEQQRNMVHYNRRFNKLITIFNCKFLKHRSLAYLWKQDFLLPFLFLLQSENAVKYLVSPIIYVWYRFCLHLKFTDIINYTLVYCTTSKYYVPCVCKRLLKNCLNLMQICQVHSSGTWTDVMETKLKLI